MHRRIRIACLGLAFAVVVACSTTSSDGENPRALGHEPSVDGMPDPTLAANKALARIWFDEVITRRNLDAIDEHYAPDYVHHGPDGAEVRGLQAVRGFAAAILAASSDRIAVVEQQVAQGDLVTTRFTSRGTHTGTSRGVEATGKEWVTEGICINPATGVESEGWCRSRESNPDEVSFGRF